MANPILFIIREPSGQLATELSKDFAESSWGDPMELEHPTYLEGETPDDDDFDIEEGRVIVSGEFSQPTSMQPWISLAEKHGLSVFVVEPPTPTNC